MSAAEDLEPPFPDDEPAPAPRKLRFWNEDGSVHFSDLKHIAKSPKHYLHACNTPLVPTRVMRLGTIVHYLTLGKRPGSKDFVVWDGRRQGNEWKLFEARNVDKEIMSAAEWADAEEIAAHLQRHPIAIERLQGARYEVPLQWEESGMKFSTSGLDIVSADGEEICDLKTTASVEPEAWQRHSFKQYNPMQLALYRRGARANGLPVGRGLFLLGIETSGPWDVVELELTEEMTDLADRTVTLWIERLRACMQSNEWPGYAQSRVPFGVPAWKAADPDEDDDLDEDEGDAAA